MNKLVPTCDEVTYVLGLEDGCIYVGKTKALKDRLDAHAAGITTTWTQLHKPLELKGVHAGNVESELYAKCVEKYGREKVRGAGHTKLTLAEPKPVKPKRKRYDWHNPYLI